jgi:glycosyltransferase involved in cell wall biosynthesis
MKIGINAQLLSHRKSYRNAGVSQYIRHLAGNVGRCAHPHDVHLFVPKSCEDAFAGCILHRGSAWAERAAARIAWEQTMLPLLVRRYSIDVLHSPVHVLPAACPCRSVVTIHDLSAFRFPQAFPPIQRRYLQLFTKRSARKADAVVAISESTRRDVIEMLGVSPDRVSVVLNGVDPSYRPAAEADRQRAADLYGIGPNDVLYLGTLEPRKNIPALITAFSRATKHLPADVRLIVAGARGWMYDSIFKLAEDLGLVERVRFVGYIPAEDHAALYSAAAVFVYPSLYEGFGLPPLEAMACGTPVIASNASSLPEVVGDAGLLVDPRDTDALGDAMIRLLGDSGLRAELRERGLERAAQFSWESSARRTLDVYEQVNRM